MSPLAQEDADMAIMTRRLVAAYAADEPWKAEHDAAATCRDVEDLLASGVLLFRRIGAIESRALSPAHRPDLAVVEAALKEVDDLYRAWIDASQKWLMKAEGLAAQGYDVEGLDAFRSVMDEAWNVVGNAELEPAMRPIEDLAASARPSNPRPERYRD